MRDVVCRAMTKAPATLNALTMADPLGNPKQPIRRRVFVAGSVALLVAPWVADGQERNPPRIGALLLTSNPENLQRQFGEALQELGYAQGRNIAIEYRSAAAGEVDHLAELAGESFVEQIQSAARDVGVRIQLIVVCGAEDEELGSLPIDAPAGGRAAASPGRCRNGERGSRPLAP
jgi:hypothetical protein